MRKVPDVCKDDLASRRALRGPVATKAHQFVPPPVCSNKDRERWEGIRRSSQKTLQEKEMRSASEYLSVAILLLFLLNVFCLSVCVVATCGLMSLCITAM